MPSVKAKSVSAQPITHVEFELERAQLEKLVRDLTSYLQTHTDPRFHLQVQRSGHAPPPGGTAVIAKDDPVTVTIHRFP